MEQQHPADTRGPPVPLDTESVRALFPPATTRWGFSRRELASALGREGAKCLAVWLACALVLAYGAVVITRAWVSEERAIPLLVGGPHLSLAVFWYMFAAAVAVCGWLLSGQVTKPWLRTFVGVGLLIAAILLITIGRSAHVGAAGAEARSEARRLLAAAAAAGVDDDEGAESALLAMLCTRGDLWAPAGGRDDTTGGDADACTIDGSNRIMWFDEDRPGNVGSDDPRHGEQLACLPGWTVDTFVEWMDAASRDRQVAALSALASCEIGVVNPVAEEEAEDEIDTSATATADDAGGGPAGDPATAGDASAAAPGADSGAEGGGDGDGDGGGGGPTPEAVAAVREALLVQRSEVKGQEAVAAGADELLTFASGSTTFAQLRFSAAAWVVVLAATLLWYRRLEIRAGAHRLGPVDVQFDKPGDKGSGHGEAEARPPANRAEAVFKESVIRNVPEPGAIPGGEALAPVGDLVAQTDMPHRTLIGGVIEAARTILATRGGFTVIFSVRPSDDRADDREGHVAFVRLRDTRTGNHLASRIVHDQSEDQAARRAGYWIAGWIISRSEFVPSWAQWSEEDAASFPPLPPAWSAGVQPAAQRSVAPEEFDPNAVNSLILAQRAYAHQTTPPRDTAGDARVRGDRTGTGDHGAADHTDRGRRNHLAALEDFARAVHHQPRYPVARYRRGAALGTMMFRGGDLAAAAGLPDDASDQARRRVLPGAARLRYLFGDLLTGDRVRPRRGGGPQEDPVEGWVTGILEDRKPFPDDMRIEMLRLVAEWTNRNRAALRWSRVAGFRPSERSFWKEFRRDGLERDWKLLLVSEVCLCAERLKLGPRGLEATPGAESPPRSSSGATRVDDEVATLVARVRARALEADSHWQISYNLACLYAIRSHLWSQLEGRDDVGDDPARSSAACRSNAFEWLERCLDRPASTQLVREWVDADGDLEPLRDEPHFEVWRRQVRSMREGPSDRRTGPGKAPEPPGGATSTADAPAGAPAVLPARPSPRRRRISPSR